MDRCLSIALHVDSIGEGDASSCSILVGSLYKSNMRSYSLVKACTIRGSFSFSLLACGLIEGGTTSPSPIEVGTSIHTGFLQKVLVGTRSASSVGLRLQRLYR